MSTALGAFRRLVSAALLLSSAAVLVAACMASPPAAPSGSAGSSPAGTHVPSSSAPASSSPPSSPPVTTTPAPRGPHPCRTRSLQVKPGISQGAAGSTYQTIVFTNISKKTCTLYGYPGISLAGGSPVVQIGLAAKENPQTPRIMVTLPPGGTATALLRIVDALNFPKRRCAPEQASYLLVYPPNQKAAVYVLDNVTGCSKPVPLLTVDVVKPGSGG